MTPFDWWCGRGRLLWPSWLLLPSARAVRADVELQRHYEARQALRDAEAAAWRDFRDADAEQRRDAAVTSVTP